MPSICDMCRKDYSDDKFSETGYFTANYEMFHLCAGCSQKIIGIIKTLE